MLEGGQTGVSDLRTKEERLGVDRDDCALLASIGKQDRAAFEELWSRWAGRVYAFLRTRVPAPVAEDLTQVVFMRVWRRAGSYRPDRAAASTWMFAIARNAAIDRLRKASRPDPDESDPCWVPSSPAAPDDAYAESMVASRVRDALDQLPDGQRSVMILTYLEGLTLSEVAEQLELPLGTVKSRVRLAMAKLRVLMASTAG